MRRATLILALLFAFPAMAQNIAVNAPSIVGIFPQITVAGPITSTADGVHAGSVALVGNTANPTMGTSTFNIFGPAVASFTAYAWQVPSTAPPTDSIAYFGTAASGASPITYPTTLPTPLVPAFTGDMSNSAGSLATTVAKINGTAFSGTNGDLVSFGAANIPADSSVVAANVVTQTSAPTANQLCVYGSTTKVCTPTTTLPTAAQPAHTGDVTNSSGSLALTIAANAVTGAKMANNTVTATQLAAQYSKGQCTEVWGGSGTSFALTSGDDTIANNKCYNDSGVTRTITAVKCNSDNASNTTTVNPTFGSAGTGTTILSGALTCGNSYAYSSTGTVSNASWTTGTGITPAMGGTLTGTSIGLLVEYTY